MTKEGRLYIVTATVLNVAKATGVLNGVLVMPLGMVEHASDAVEDVAGTQASQLLEDAQLPRERHDYHKIHTRRRNDYIHLHTYLIEIGATSV